jgi:hypothetical protein
MPMLIAVFHGPIGRYELASVSARRIIRAIQVRT